MNDRRRLARWMFGALLVGVATPAAAVDVASLAERSGLTERQVRMVLGAPSAYVEYRSSYLRATGQLRAIVGSDRAMRELAEEFQIEQEYEFEVLVDGVPLDEAESRDDATATGDRRASLRAIENGDAHR